MDKLDQFLTWLPERFQPVAKFEIFGYTLWQIAIIIFLVFAGILLSTIIRYYIQRIILRVETKKTIPPFIINTMNSLKRPVRILIWACALLVSSTVVVNKHVTAVLWLGRSLLNISLMVFIWDFVLVLEELLLNYAKRSDTKLDDLLVPILRRTIRVVVIIIIALQLYQSITNQNITTILAGFGIAGMAVALAGQDTIKNLFGFLMIVLDKPYQIGDRIDFDGHDGVIEDVGLRSTKLRRLDGHMVTIPNSKIADSVIHNISKRPNIRRIMNIGITYDTDLVKVEQAVNIIQQILDNHEGMHPDLTPRVFFNDLKSDSLNIIAIYWYHPPDYWNYMSHCQKINLQIMQEFEKANIEFAFPTQTLYLAGDTNRDLNFTIKNMQALNNNQKIN